MLPDNIDGLEPLREQVSQAESRRLINVEYRRGFVEGQHETLMFIAEYMDKMLANHDCIVLIVTTQDISQFPVLLFDWKMTVHSAPLPRRLNKTTEPFPYRLRFYDPVTTQ